MRTETAIELSTERLLGAADRGADHLARSLLPNGQFVSRRSALTGQQIPGDDDLRWHFGALWAMLDVRGYDPAVQAAGARGMQWAIERYYQRTPEGGAFGSRSRLLTGCSGLALLALDELAPEHGHVATPEVRAEIVDFLLANQISDGARQHDFPRRVELRRFTIDLSRAEVTVAPDRERLGRSATGQILFGLITCLSTLADRRGDGGEFDGQRFALVYTAVGNAMAALLTRDRRVQRGSHWTMYAIRRFAELTDRLLAEGGHAEHELARESRRDLLAWASRIAAGVLVAAPEERGTPAGSAARRVQAQVQFLDLVDAYTQEPVGRPGPEVDELVDAARRQIERDCTLLLQLQDGVTGGFLSAAEEPIMRIDDTQHAISALLGAGYAIGG